MPSLLQSRQKVANLDWNISCPPKKEKAVFNKIIKIISQIIYRLSYKRTWYRRSIMSTELIFLQFHINKAVNFISGILGNFLRKHLYTCNVPRVFYCTLFSCNIICALAWKLQTRLYTSNPTVLSPEREFTGLFRLRIFMWPLENHLHGRLLNHLK